MHRPGHTSASWWHSRATHKDCRGPVILPLLAVEGGVEGGGVSFHRGEESDSPYVVLVWWDALVTVCV